ncbi:hypothetical protein BCR61_21560 [Xanthomonas oryzae pv. oryzae]|nr:hypothetical protein [Xanthomonas oryzae]AXQ10776.1 hypothetical protein BCR61_21560 [Xanthomonas oryzae pv. oryzae]AXQ76705.1 hypothetical protein BXU03_21240 [Xanthomonas oryzae pv. oryzae]
MDASSFRTNSVSHLWCVVQRFLSRSKSQLAWAMLGHLAIVERRKQKELSLLVDAVGLPKIALRTIRAIDRFYRLERVQRPDWRS